jgi:O-antigen/teichoic acid export membrane protein
MANLILLIPFKMGLEGYFIANCLGPFAQIIYLLVRLKCWKYIKLNNDKTLEREMILYARPLIANSVAWWVNSASDRYIVTFICGVAVNGIYSVGYKIPSILAVFTNIFNQAWTLSAVHEFDSEDKGGFFSDMYNIYNFVITVFCSVLLIFTRIMAKFLYAKDFFEAWKFVPFLLIAFVFSSLSGYIGGIFSAVKDSKIFAKSTVIGAIVNIILNFILVICIGAIGAAISTIISYFVIWAIRVLNSKKYIKIKFYLLRDFLAYALLLIQTGLLFIVQKETYYLYLLEASLLFVILSLFKREIIFGLKRIKNFIKSINGL